MLEKAKQLCKKIYFGQFDRNGEPFYVHLFSLAEMFESEEEKIVALLMDIFENSSYTLESLAILGFSKRVILALEIITKTKNQTNDEYFKAVKANTLARVVKIAEMTNNLERQSVKIVTEKERKRRDKMLRYLQFLKNND